MTPLPAGPPAMDHDGSVSSPPLYHQHMFNDCHDGRRGGAQTLRGPAGYLELSHLVTLTRLQSKCGEAMASTLVDQLYIKELYLKPLDA